MRSDNRPNTTKNGVPISSAVPTQHVRQPEVDLQRVLQEEQRVELARVPHHALSARGAEQREQHELQIAPLPETLRERRARVRAVRLHFDEQRRLGELEPDVDRDREQNHRDEERHAPAPRAKRFFAESDAATENHRQRQEKAERCGRLDPARVVTALVRRRVFGHICRGAAVLAAERESLREPQRNEQHRRPDADLRVRRQHADERGRQSPSRRS